MRHRALWAAVTLLCAAVAVPDAARARVPDAAAAAICAKETKRLKTFQRGMKAAKRRYFRAHRSARVRKRFVKAQRRRLAQLERARRRCLARPPSPAPPGTGTPAPAPAPGGGPAPVVGPDPPALDSIEDVFAPGARFEPGEVSSEDGVEYVRTQLELELAPGATDGAVDALLARLGADVVSSLKGVGLLTVRVPDPGDLAAARALVASLAGEAALASAELATVPVTTELPDTIAPADAGLVRPQLASRAAGAWNARAGLTTAGAPTLVVTDYFGAGPPGAEVAVQEAAADFATGNVHPHGYSMLGLAAGTFEPGAIANLQADQVTGMWAGPDLPLRVVDLRSRIAGSTMEDRLLQVIRGLPGDVVVSTSLAAGCAPARCTAAEISTDAVQWIQRVRGAGLEGRFLHVVAAGNIYPNLQDDTEARFGSPFIAAAKTPLPGGVANLTNTIAVENTTASDPAAGPIRPVCLTRTSKRGGDVSAVGNDIRSLGAPGTPRSLAEGGTSSAAPQVAGAAATLWALAPSLTPAQLADLLRRTSRPVQVSPAGDGRCDAAAQPAPALDAHAAVLAADGAATQPARKAVLDADEDGSFDEQDIAAFRDAFVASVADGVVDLDYGRHDLNGDGYTGGGRDRFDLDASSPPAWTFSRRREVLGLEIGHDETSVRDLDVLCHEANGPLYTGDAAARDTFDAQYCLPPVELTVDPAFPGTLQPGQTAQLRVVARRTDLTDPASSQQPGVHLDLAQSSGTLGAVTGTTGQDGAFATTAGLGPSGGFEAVVIARAGAGGPELDRVTVSASRQGAGRITGVAVSAEVRAYAEACAGRDGEGCTVESKQQRSDLTTFGAFSGSAGAAEDEQGTDGFYAGNSASADSSAAQTSELRSVAGPPEIVASGSSGGTALRTFGEVESAHAAYNGNSSVFMRFTVVDAAVPYAAAGTVDANGAGTANALFSLYRTSNGFQEIARAEDGDFEVSGTLPPGTYEMGTGASCSSDRPGTCTASFDVSFDVDP